MRETSERSEATQKVSKAYIFQGDGGQKNLQAPQNSEKTPKHLFEIRQASAPKNAYFTYVSNVKTSGGK